MKSIIQILIFCFVLSLIYSCKKDEDQIIIPEIPEIKPDITETTPAENYFTFLEVGNEFTYRRICTETRYQKPLDTVLDVTNKVLVSKSKAESYYELSRAFPEIDTRILYSDSICIGLSPFDTIMGKSLESNFWNSYYQLTKKKASFEGDSLEVFSISNEQQYEFDDILRVYISKDKGVIWTSRAKFHSDWRNGANGFKVEHLCTCELIDYNF